MLMLRERRPSYRTIEGWAICLLLEEGAIRQCPDHGYMQCRGDPDARRRACEAAKEHPPAGLTAEDAVAALHNVLAAVGDACPDC
jgi:hypothetical protein